MRFLPRNHDGVNEEWLSDKSRFVWDGLRRQRLDRPYVRKGGKLTPVGWNEAFAAIASAANGKKIAGIAGDLAPVEAMFALKQLVEGLGGAVECRTDGAKLPAGNRSGYVGTARIEDLDEAEKVLLIGTNPRIEAPVLNARIRKAWLRGAQIALVGEAADLTYDYHHAGDTTAALNKMIDEGVSDEEKGKSSVVVIGQGALIGDDGTANLAGAMRMCEVLGAKLLVLHTAASRVGAMDIGFTNDSALGVMNDADVIWNLGADEIEIGAGAFVIYQGSHGDRGAHRADVILPGAAWTEENGLFVNTEGRPQRANRAGFAPGEARDNWAIIRAASAHLGQTLPYDNLLALRKALFEAVPHLASIDSVPENEWHPVDGGQGGEQPMRSPVEDHYLTNPIARASEVMAELSKLAHERALPIAAE